MATIHALAEQGLTGQVATGQAQIVSLRNGVVARSAAQESFYIEDGWVFREHHGKYVECICRTDEMPAAHGPNLNVIQAG